MVETLPAVEPEYEPVTESPPSAPYLEEVVEGRVIRMLDHPITFDEWLEICGPKDFHELEDGVLVEKPMVQWEHEKAESWLLVMLKIFVEKHRLGVVLHSRCAMRIGEFRGRLPDIFFVSKDRQDIVQNDATRGAPDFIAEVVSPYDRPSHLFRLQSDYLEAGVPEIWFIDLPGKRLRILRKERDAYTEEIMTEGPVRIQAVEGFEVRVEWLLQEPRPDVLDTELNLLNSK